MNSEEISHKGRIVAIDPQFTTVEIISESACSACHASGLCGISEAKTKAIQIPTTVGPWSVGQEVDVLLKRGMGFKAVWLSYVIPLIVLLAVLLVLVQLGVKELVSGLIALGATALYYFILWLFRNKLRNEYSFYIK